MGILRPNSDASLLHCVIELENASPNTLLAAPVQRAFQQLHVGAHIHTRTHHRISVALHVRSVAHVEDEELI